MKRHYLAKQDPTQESDREDSKAVAVRQAGRALVQAAAGLGWAHSSWGAGWGPMAPLQQGQGGREGQKRKHLWFQRKQSN